jgi:hypothetical protein
MLSSTRTIAAFLTVALSGLACGGAPQRVALLKASGIPSTMTPANSIPLEVVTRSTAVPDPLPVAGSHVVYGDVEAALGLAVSSAAAPWAEAHRPKQPEGWQMSVELTGADAEEKGGRLVVTFSVRATLRTRADRRYLGQTQASCRQAGLVEPEEGGAVVYACMSRIGRDLAGWLGGLDSMSSGS